MRKLFFVVLLGFFVGVGFFFFFYHRFKLPALILGDGPDIEFFPFPVWDKLHKIGVESKSKAKKFPICWNKCLEK